MRGIQIKTAKGFLELPEKTKVSVEESSPFFDRESLRVTFNTPIKLPLTPPNQAILENPELIENSEIDAQGVDAALLSDGVRMYDGFVKINDVDSNLNKRNGTYNVSLLDERGAYADKVEGKTLKDLTLGGIIAVAGDDTTEFDDISGTITSAILGEKSVDFATDVMLNGHDYVCFPTMQVADEYYTQINKWDDANNKYLSLFDLSIPFDTGADLFSINPYTGQITITHEDGGTGIPNVVGTLVPMYYYHQVIRHCFLDFGYKIIDGGILDNPYFKKHAIVNNFAFVKQRINKLTLTALGVTTEHFHYMERTTEINPANHLPEMDIREFLNDFMIKFGVAFDIKGEEVFVKQININPAVKKGSQNPVYNRAIQKPDLVKLYYAYEDEHRGYTDNVEDYKLGNDKEFSCPLIPCWGVQTEEHYMADGRFGLTKFAVELYKGAYVFPPGPPYALNYAGFAKQNIEEYDMPKMFGIFHGLLATSGALKSAFMSRDNRLHNDDYDVIGDWSLYWKSEYDEYGLVDVFLTQWLRIFASKVKDTFYFNDDYLELLDNEWGRFQIIRNQLYYVAKRKYQLPLVKEVTYECYKIT